MKNIIERYLEWRKIQEDISKDGKQKEIDIDKFFTKVYEPYCQQNLYTTKDKKELIKVFENFFNDNKDNSLTIDHILSDGSSIQTVDIVTNQFVKRIKDNYHLLGDQDKKDMEEFGLESLGAKRFIEEKLKLYFQLLSDDLKANLSMQNEEKSKDCKPRSSPSKLEHVIQDKGFVFLAKSTIRS